MSESPFPQITLVRHGETAWSRSGQHTGRSDIPLTPEGEEAARALALAWRHAPTRRSGRAPSSRAATTCALAGFGDGRTIDPDLRGMGSRAPTRAGPLQARSSPSGRIGGCSATAAPRARRQRTWAPGRTGSSVGPGPGRRPDRVLQRASPAGARRALDRPAAAGRRAPGPRHRQRLGARL
ncbi:phosphoglycerate mutase family protein [Methylobacterium oryzae CBMB20]